MSADSITFYCPACKVRLTVPVRLAGVTGPCPACRSLIQAPRPVAAPSLTPIPPLDPPAPPPPAPAEPAAKPSFRPEPRQLPQRPPHIEQPVGKPMSEAASTGSSGGYTHHHRRSKLSLLIRLALFLLFIAVPAGIWILIGGRKDPPAPSSSAANTSGAPGSPSPLPPVSPPADAVPLPPPADHTVAAATRAYDTLEKFLAAATLEQRLPLIETRTDPAQLADTVLARPLPSVLRFATDIQETNSLENLTDIFYNVDFDAGNGLANPQTILVRIRGEAPPKIVADPFLDLYGGRLARFASEKTDKGATFQVIASSTAYCYEDSVPNRDKKMTLRLLARDNTREVAKAYFGRRSKIGELLADDTSEFQHGQARACTIFLRWNLEEDPEKPYLEALDIKSLNWNP